MNYLEWNDAVAAYLFNEDKAGESVFLYLTRDEITQLYCDQSDVEKNGNEVWKDFVQALNYPTFSVYSQDLSGMGLYDRMLEFYRLSHLRTFQDVFKYPPYILYLVALVLPLTELAAEESVLIMNQSNYYDRAKAFFRKNRIFFEEGDFSTPELKKICTDHKEKGYCDLWKDLEQWSQEVRKHELGDFSKMIIGKDVYVGIIRAQCLITADELRKLPQVYIAAGLEEGEDYQPEDFHKALVRHGKGILKEPILKILATKGNEEVKKLILNIVVTNHLYWDGALYHYDEQNRRKYTELYAEKKLKLQLVKTRNEVALGYRIFSKKGYPNDLEIGGQFVADEREGWSCVLNYGFDGNSFVKTDRSFKWRLTFEAKDIYLLGKNPELPFIPRQSCYIQQNGLSRYEEMFLLVRHGVVDKIRDWGKTFEEGNFAELDELEGIPEGFILFRFRYPQKGLEGVKELTLPVLKKVKVEGGMPMGNRRYLQGFLPVVYLEGGDGKEELWLAYENGQKEKLSQDEQDGVVFWQLPPDIEINVPWEIVLSDGVFEQGLKYEIIAPLFPEECELRKRNNLGEEYKGEESYVIGNVPKGIEKFNLLGLPTKNEQHYQFATFSVTGKTASKGNLLADWLYLKGCTTKLQFYEVFDNLYYWNNLEYFWENSDWKRLALNWFHYAGFIDYDYKAGKVTALPPFFVALPAKNRPNRFLLAGARSLQMIEKIGCFCEKYRKNVRLEINQQHESLRSLLLPDAVVVEVTGNREDDYGIDYIRNLVRELSIESPVEMQLQAKLVAFAPSVKDFVMTGQYQELDEFHQAVKRLYFDRQRFIFTDKIDNLPEDDMRLVEFQLRKWSTEYGIVKAEGMQEKVCFLNKNWGRYFMLEHSCSCCSSVFKGAKNTGIVFYDSNRQCLAVWVEFPLPEFLNKAVIFLSGCIPAREKLLINGEIHPYYVYRDCPPAFIRAIFLTKMNIVLESFSYERSNKIV